MPSIFCHMQKGVFLVVTIAVQLWQKANGSRMVFKAIHENRLRKKVLQSGKRLK